MYSVLFVCTANICRSPMAMGLFREKVGDTSEWRIESAGTWAVENVPAASGTRQVLEKRGINLSTHRSRTITRELLRDFNLILTMETGHAEALRAEFPEIGDRVHLISGMIGMAYNIQDPIGHPLDEFEELAREFKKIFSDGFETISKLAKD